jgi:hypothetical protein
MISEAYGPILNPTFQKQELLAMFIVQSKWKEDFLYIGKSEIKIAFNGHVLSNQNKMRNFYDDIPNTISAKKSLKIPKE